MVMAAMLTIVLVIVLAAVVEAAGVHLQLSNKKQDAKQSKLQEARANKHQAIQVTSRLPPRERRSIGQKAPRCMAGITR